MDSAIQLCLRVFLLLHCQVQGIKLITTELVWLLDSMVFRTHGNVGIHALDKIKSRLVHFLNLCGGEVWWERIRQLFGWSCVTLPFCFGHRVNLIALPKKGRKKEKASLIEQDFENNRSYLISRLQINQFNSHSACENLISELRSTSYVSKSGIRA